ncbi:tetratricopeptide repeat protein [Streptomyces sp. NPDC005917]|uniref:tetratricopeptide repeat protein n=1 Tax=unclassified Streptomyces TaxID=2593676 RepID=UPI0033F2A98A
MSIWPRWSMEGEPAALAKYVLPDEVAALVRLPGPPARSRIAQVRTVYEALADAGITYSHEAPSDEPDRQVIRDPGEVLWSPKHATCLDLTLVMAGACLHAGLHPLVLILDPPETGRAAHALLGVWVGDPPPDGFQVPDADVWSAPPEDWLGLVQQDIGGRPRPLLLLDPVGIAQPLPASPILGARASFADAVRAGVDYAATWNWRLAVDVGRAWRAQDTHTPANRPQDQPLRSPYVELDPRVHRPLEVLKAEHAVVPFQARDELTVLTHFCRTIAEGPHTGITLIHGAGGAGKTRLALELAHQLDTYEGWYTGYLRESTDGDDWLGAVVSPTLIVLDYAEARPADAQRLLTILKRRTERGATPAVLVMTARSAAGQWLTNLRRAWERDGHLCRELAPLELPPEHPDGSALFRRAIEAFVEEPGSVDVSAAERATPVEWTTLDYILLAYLASRSSGKLPNSREELYEEVLDHERGYWTQTYRQVIGNTADAPIKVLSRAVACLTLRAPTTHIQTIAALRAVEELADAVQWREAIRATLTVCLQPGPGEALVLRPDPIADHLALRELRDDPNLLNRALDGLEPEPLLEALRQLNRAASAHPGTAANLIAAWTEGEPGRWLHVLRVASEQSGSALAALCQLIDADPAPAWLDDLSQAIPFMSVGLPQLGLQAESRRLTELRSSANPAPADLAVLLQRLGQRQANIGDYDRAIATVREAVEIRRALVKADPVTHLPELAASLNILCGAQSDLGDHKGALASVKEAVEIRRTLAQADPSTHLPDLAMVLSNLSVLQRTLGEREGSLATVEEAIEIRRTLAQADSGMHLAGLATTLNNLGASQSDLGDHKRALASSAEAVEIYRELFKNSPTEILPDLAASLNNLSAQQSKTGDPGGALASITEAVDHFWDLSVINPATFLPRFATTLNNLSTLQGDVGDHEGALTSADQSVKIQRELAEINPVAHLPELANSLKGLSECQSQFGDAAGALSSAEEAVDIRRELAENNQRAFLPGLASSLNNLSNRQSQVGDSTGALISVNEAVHHYQLLTKAHPEAFLPDLAMALANYARCQNENGDHPGALASITQAVDYYRLLIEKQSATFLPDLAMSLNSLAAFQDNAGIHAEALASITEAVAIRRDLSTANPKAFLADLAMSLNNLSVMQAMNGDPAGSVAPIVEAVRINRTLARTYPGAYLPRLASSLSNLSNRQSEIGDLDSAMDSAMEALTIDQKLAKTNSGAHLPNLASSLHDFATLLTHRKDSEGALASVTKAVEIRRALSEENAAVHLPALASSLNNLAGRQSETGNLTAALASSTEAVNHCRTLVKNNPTSFLPHLAASLNNLASRQSETGNLTAALASSTEAVNHYRTLVKNNPTSFLPHLAASLNNLASRQSETGNLTAALASSTEAVNHYRTLVKNNPTSFLPHLAASLNNLASRQSDASAITAAWEDAAAILEENVLAQAELRSYYAGYLAENIGTDCALNQLIQASRAAQTGSPHLLRRTRHQIRNIVIRYSINDPQLPNWATHPLPDDFLELLNQWAQASDWPRIKAFLDAHSSKLQHSDFQHRLDLTAALFPDDPHINTLIAFLDEAEAQSFITVLERGQREHEARLLLEKWVNTPTWTDSKKFIDQHECALRTPEIQALLVGSDAPEARRHLAILQLAEQVPLDEVYEIVTDKESSTEQAFHAMDQGDIPRLRSILYAHERPLTGITGALFATVISTADGHSGQARRLAKLIAQHGTPIQRRAYAIRLRTLAKHDHELAFATELAALIDPDDNS